MSDYLPCIHEGNCAEYGNWPDGYRRALVQQPLTVIPGFDSFYRCRGAGMEMQARLRSDGYVVDFACLLQGK